MKNVVKLMGLEDGTHRAVVSVPATWGKCTGVIGQSGASGPFLQGIGKTPSEAYTQLEYAVATAALEYLLTLEVPERES